MSSSTRRTIEFHRIQETLPYAARLRDESARVPRSRELIYKLPGLTIRFYLACNERKTFFGEHYSVVDILSQYSTRGLTLPTLFISH